MENLKIRKMEAGETKVVHQLACSSFSGLQRLFIPKPKLALVATLDDKIVAGVLLKKIKVGNQRFIGHIDYIFVGKGYRGKGIGEQLYNSAVKFLEDDCQDISAIVLDDNTSSFKIFKGIGFNIPQISNVFKKFGIFGTLNLWWNSSLFIAFGHFLWLKSEQPHKNNSFLQLAYFLILNAVFLALTPTRNKIIILSLCSLLIIEFIGGFVGSLFSKSRGVFKLTQGGLFISIIVALLSGFIPMPGNFYPKDYSSPKDYATNKNRLRKDLGITSLIAWIFILLSVSISFYLDNICGINSVFLSGVTTIGMHLLLYKSIAIFPFESFGGMRVLKWNKPIYALMLILSLGIMVVSHIVVTSPSILSINSPGR